MKTRLLVPMTAVILSALPLAQAASAAPKAPKKPSLISAYAGPHNGTLFLSGNGVSAFGPTTGHFSGSKKKESGTLSLQSVVSASGSTIVLGEQFTFTKHSVSYVLTEVVSGSSIAAPGFGTAAIHKNSISYSITLNLEGQTIFIVGTIKLAKNNHLNILETLSTDGQTLVLNYQLGGKKKKK